MNFELAELYFPMFVIQCRYDIFPLRNRSFRKNEILTGDANGIDIANRDPDLDDDLFAY